MNIHTTITRGLGNSPVGTYVWNGLLLGPVGLELASVSHSPPPCLASKTEEAEVGVAGLRCAAEVQDRRARGAGLEGACLGAGRCRAVGRCWAGRCWAGLRSSGLSSCSRISKAWCMRQGAWRLCEVFLGELPQSADHQRLARPARVLRRHADLPPGLLELRVSCALLPFRCRPS